jgi:dihydropteroate synthase
VSSQKDLTAGRHKIVLGARAKIVGIVNVTPDSFFDRGKYYDSLDPGPAIERALVLIAAGADIIDLGGETAQPSSPVMSVEEEIRRVVPVIAALAKQTNVPLSVDTYKPGVARAALAAGASIINDTSGLADEELGTIAAETGAAIVVMHIPCHPKERIEPGYEDVVGAVSQFLRLKTQRLEELGVPPERIIIDPGIGFGKKPHENLKLIAETRLLKRLGYALLFACSRRTFLGNLMGGEPPEERLEATVAVNAAAILNGADLIRVHDVAFMSKLSKMLGMVRALS